MSLWWTVLRLLRLVCFCIHRESPLAEGCPCALIVHTGANGSTSAKGWRPEWPHRCAHVVTVVAPDNLDDLTHISIGHQKRPSSFDDNSP